MTTPLEIIFRKYLTNQSVNDTVSPVSEITKAAATLGRLGGLAKSAKKSAAVKANGKLGGRPRIKNPKPESIKRRLYRERNA